MQQIYQTELSKRGQKSSEVGVRVNYMITFGNSIYEATFYPLLFFSLFDLPSSVKQQIKHAISLAVPFNIMTIVKDSFND